jgi:hypothetical protein
LGKAQKDLQKVRCRVEKGCAKSKTRRGISEDVTFEVCSTTTAARKVSLKNIKKVKSQAS